MKELLSSLHISLMKLTSSLSRREKLLLGLLTSTLIFSASFSYGAVNQSKVDSIMQTINNAASNFSSQADRDTYYNRVYTGLSDAIDMLAVVRNNVGAMIGTPPVSTPPVSTPPTFTPPASNSAWASPTRVTCPTSVTALQSANPSTVSATNSAGFQYTNTGGIYFNVKNYANASDTALPTSCTTGQKWIAKSGTNSCSIYSCATATPPVSTPPVSG